MAIRSTNRGVILASGDLGGRRQAEAFLLRPGRFFFWARRFELFCLPRGNLDVATRRSSEIEQTREAVNDAPMRLRVPAFGGYFVWSR